MIQLFLAYTPQPCRKVTRAIESFGFTKKTHNGSHAQYELVRDGVKFKVTIDCHRGEVSAKNIKSIVAQAGLSKMDFLKALQS